ncbi:hypothetical protein [Pseudomonas batumici]|uniref:hypothetical protein n=1 Tax=Pseudomonas batumici TaxID=226910 RepID=UPI0012EE6ACD|nr:hypothetical protein [Pseudomonas batumici]
MFVGLADRPSFDYNDSKHGAKFHLTFRWGADSDPVPTTVVVLAYSEGGKTNYVADILSDSWATLDDAVADGEKAADKFSERHWV